MKISALRKIYPMLKETSKNIKWRSLTDKELDEAMKSKQIVANCYDEATRYVLLGSEKGRDLLRKRIKIQKGTDVDQAYKFKLNVNGKDEIYRATQKDYLGKYYDVYKDYFGKNEEDLFKSHPIRLSLGVNVGVGKMISKHPEQKSFFSRLYLYPLFRNRSFEFNKPSNAFKWFTGKTPVAIGESDLKNNLKNHRAEVYETLNELGKSTNKDYSFVAISGFNKPTGGAKWHCYPIVGVDNKKQTITVLNKRTNMGITLGFDKAIETFKAIVGIDWKKTK